MHSISITMWGDEICDKSAELSFGDLLAIKGAKVSDYGGRTLNASGDSTGLFTDLKSEQADKIRNWFNQEKLQCQRDGRQISDLLQSAEPLSERRVNRADMQAQNGGNEKKSNFNVSQFSKIKFINLNIYHS